MIVEHRCSTMQLILNRIRGVLDIRLRVNQYGFRPDVRFRVNQTGFRPKLWVKSLITLCKVSEGVKELNLPVIIDFK